MTEIAELPKLYTDYAHAMHVLNYGLPQMPGDLHAGEFGLERVFELLERLGSPQNQLKIVHLAGTSGKGTTAYMIERLLRERGFTTGLSVSPYVYDMKERWYVNGEFLSDDVILQAAQKLLPHLHAAQDEGRLTTRFESMIALAFLIMHEQSVDYLVLETGMGGLLDPTNTVLREDKISVLTSVGLDHTHILGTDVTKIAAHKAGIIQPKSDVFTFQQPEHILEAIKTAAHEKNARLHIVPPLNDAESYEQPMFAVNASIARAVSACICDRESVSGATLEEDIALLNALIIPGRNQIIELADKKIMLDGAHNIQKLNALAEALKKQWSRETTSIVAVLAKPDQLHESLQALDSLGRRIIVVDYPKDVIDFKQATPFNQIQAAADELSIEVEFADYAEALSAIRQSSDNWLITGSFYHLQYFSSNLA